MTTVNGGISFWYAKSGLPVPREPLPADVWATIGWEGREALGDMAHAHMYAQRTADDRIAVGGRGVPYRFGSQTDRVARLADRISGRHWAVT
jgi:hypothetical protein